MLWSHEDVYNGPFKARQYFLLTNALVRIHIFLHDKLSPTRANVTLYNQQLGQRAQAKDFGERIRLPNNTVFVGEARQFQLNSTTNCIDYLLEYCDDDEVERCKRDLQQTIAMIDDLLQNYETGQTCIDILQHMLYFFVTTTINEINF
jgi:hypothetical protein